MVDLLRKSALFFNCIMFHDFFVKTSHKNHIKAHKKIVLFKIYL